MCMRSSWSHIFLQFTFAFWGQKFNDHLFGGSSHTFITISTVAEYLTSFKILFYLTFISPAVASCAGLTHSWPSIKELFYCHFLLTLWFLFIPGARFYHFDLWLLEDPFKNRLDTKNLILQSEQVHRHVNNFFTQNSTYLLLLAQYFAAISSRICNVFSLIFCSLLLFYSRTLFVIISNCTISFSAPALCYSQLHPVWIWQVYWRNNAVLLRLRLICD